MLAVSNSLDLLLDFYDLDPDVWMHIIVTHRRNDQLMPWSLLWWSNACLQKRFKLSACLYVSNQLCRSFQKPWWHCNLTFGNSFNKDKPKCFMSRLWWNSLNFQREIVPGQASAWESMVWAKIVCLSHCTVARGSQIPTGHRRQWLSFWMAETGIRRSLLYSELFRPNLWGDIYKGHPKMWREGLPKLYCIALKHL